MTHVSRLNYLGGEFVKTSDFNLTELPLATGSLPLVIGTVILQDSPEGLNKLVLTLTSPTHGFSQLVIYPSVLDIGTAEWVFFGDIVRLRGPNHKEILYPENDDFEITKISGR